MTTQKKAPAKASRKKQRQGLYHHGDLKQALVQAGLALAEESGQAGVSVREAARRAGVSPAAPFRHFPSRASLMAAIAEEAMRRFRREADLALKDSAAEPLARMRAVGVAYLRWALRNPAHFEIVSTAGLFDFSASSSVFEADNSHIRGLLKDAVTEAAEQGQLRVDDANLVELAGRAMVYGFARMKIDGHFPRWGVKDADAERLAEAILDLFIAGVAKRA